MGKRVFEKMLHNLYLKKFFGVVGYINFSIDTCEAYFYNIQIYKIQFFDQNKRISIRF